MKQLHLAGIFFRTVYKFSMAHYVSEPIGPRGRPNITRIVSGLQALNVTWKRASFRLVFYQGTPMVIKIILPILLL